MSDTIERQSPVPYYEQLVSILREQILEGHYPADERLPSELELCRAFGLSRATVRQTMQSLEKQGLAKRVPGRGVFATVPGEALGWTVQDHQGFLENQVRHGRTGVATEVLDAAFVSPAEHVRTAFGIEPQDEVFALTRVRSRDGDKAMFSTNWFPRAVSPVITNADDVLNGSGSVNSALRQAGYIPHRARRVLDALAAPADVASHLGIPVAHPTLRIRSSSWDQTGLCFDYYETWVLTDVVPLEVEVSTGV